MPLTFFKYQSTGNDFVVVDNRAGTVALTEAHVAFLCHRRFGIGADGLMLLNAHEDYHFEMVYFNSDGRPSSMCGNGGRSLVRFAADLGLSHPVYRFLAVDGEHEARIEDNGEVALKMADVPTVSYRGNRAVLDTGSPHCVLPVENLKDLDVFAEGRAVRNGDEFREKGINVNFVEAGERPGRISVRTYERGVEDETWSCGTGVTAAALVNPHNQNGFNTVTVETRGGRLRVEYEKQGNTFTNVWLIGPAVKVFAGEVEVEV